MPKDLKSQFDLNHPFFAPLWRRVVLVAALAAWTAVEVASNAPFWAILFGAATAWCIYGFFVAWRDPE